MRPFFLLTISLLAVGQIVNAQKIDTTGIILRMLENYVYLDSAKLKIMYIKAKMTPIFDNSATVFIDDWEKTNNTKLDEGFKSELSDQYYVFRGMLALVSDSFGRSYSPSPQDQPCRLCKATVSSYLDQYIRQKKNFHSLESYWIDGLNNKDLLITDLIRLNGKRPFGVHWLPADAPESSIENTRAWWEAGFYRTYSPAYTTIIIRTNIDSCTVLSGDNPIGFTSNFKLSIQIPLNSEQHYVVQKEGYLDYTFTPIKLDKIVAPPKSYKAEMKKSNEGR